MDLFTQLFGGFLAFDYHCFDRIVIYGYLSGLSRPERVPPVGHWEPYEPRGSRTDLGARGGEIPPRDSLATEPPGGTLRS